ncbi:MAG: shikimate kinase [Deltaproteobacteria bacterium]|nr:shikimate kinase [Deltaproteobacteria bacterium]
MASGKTTVGRIVAARVGWEFHDLDKLISDAAGRSVARIFADEGEAGFRRREADALRATTRLNRAVVATGGGAACNDENLSLMLASGRVIALEVTPEEVLRRAGTNSGRPLLLGGDAAGVDTDVAATAPRDRASALLATRQRFYARAHQRIDTMGKSPEDVAHEVLGLIEADPS